MLWCREPVEKKEFEPSPFQNLLTEVSAPRADLSPKQWFSTRVCVCEAFQWGNGLGASAACQHSTKQGQTPQQRIVPQKLSTGLRLKNPASKDSLAVARRVGFWVSSFVSTAQQRGGES